MDPQGFEPWASSLQRRHSTTELWARVSPSSSKVSERMVFELGRSRVSHPVGVVSVVRR